MDGKKPKKEEDPLIVRRNVLDSVFHQIVDKPKFLRLIYLSLYPMDTEVKEEDLKLVSSETVFLGGVIHDCCFTVRNEKAVYIEVQSTECKLLPERMICYWANTIKKINPEYRKKQGKERHEDAQE